MEGQERMPWRTESLVEQRREFCVLAQAGVVSFRELASRFGISPKTGYKWLARYEADGVDGLVDRSRAPLVSPKRTSVEVEELVCGVREEHPSWGGRKIRWVLQRRGIEAVPAPSTITGILRRNGLMEPPVAAHTTTRFEAEYPNRMWQMDFKGNFETEKGRCDPFDVLDDHSRFSLCLRAGENQQSTTVKHYLGATFETYGLPERILCDNGVPWSNHSSEGRWTRLGVWLIDLGVSMIHSRPYHPQTLGKDERFHQTLDREVLSRHHRWGSHSQVQAAFDQWRPVYNHERPHEALGGDVPADRYQPSPRSIPTRIEEPQYPDSHDVRLVDALGRIVYKSTRYRISKALPGRPVGLRHIDETTIDIYYRHQYIKTIHIETH